jgi:hypothetical protein
MNPSVLMLPYDTGTIENRMDKDLFIEQFPEPCWPDEVPVS